jgi:hypothetical protein
VATWVKISLGGWIKMPVNRRAKYVDHMGRQPKQDSVRQSNELVYAIKKILEEAGLKCQLAEEVKDGNISGAPAIQLPDGRLVLAPDLYCEYKGRRFWVEVKDKCQRFFYEDTGINLQELVSFYDVQQQREEPILLIFQDDSLEECLAKNAENEKKERYRIRWQKFGGKPYGNWLENLLQAPFPYPLMSKDHSRRVAMYIVYFPVNLMHSLETILSTFLQDPKNVTNTSERASLKLYTFAQMHEEDIREKLKEMTNLYESLKNGKSSKK